MTKYKTDMNITKIDKYKKMNMAEHKTDMNIKLQKLNMMEHKRGMTITKIDKYKKLNSNSMTEHKTDILNTKTDHDRTQNTHEHY